MNSLEKVAAALDGAEKLLEHPQLTAPARMALSGMLLSRDAVTRMLPQDPAELDALLERGSGWFLELRSDPEELEAPADAIVSETVTSIAGESVTS